MKQKAIIRYYHNETDEEFGLKEAQLVLKEILKKFQMFCDDNKLIFSLTYGSLLGAMREHDIIPWDDDIDLMMEDSEIERLEQCLDRINQYGLSWYSYKNSSNIYTNEIRIFMPGFYRLLEDNKKLFITPLCIDIFPLSRITINSDGTLPKKSFKHLNNIQRYKKRLILKKAKYNSKSYIRFLGRKLKRAIYLFPLERTLHFKINDEISKLYFGGENFDLFSPFADESFRLKFSKRLLNNIELTKFGDGKTYVINNYDDFLTRVYGDWKTPADRTSGASVSYRFIKRVE